MHPVWSGRDRNSNSALVLVAVEAEVFVLVAAGVAVIVPVAAGVAVIVLVAGEAKVIAAAGTPQETEPSVLAVAVVAEGSSPAEELLAEAPSLPEPVP